MAKSADILYLNLFMFVILLIFNKKFDTFIIVMLLHGIKYVMTHSHVYFLYDGRV